MKAFEPQRFCRSTILVLLCVVSLAIPLSFSPWTTECGAIKLLILHVCVVAGIGAWVVGVVFGGRKYDLRWYRKKWGQRRANISSPASVRQENPAGAGADACAYANSESVQGQFTGGAVPSNFSGAGLHWAVAAFVAVVTLSALSSRYPHAGVSELWRTLMFAALYALTVNAVRTERALKAIAICCEIALLSVCLYALAQRMGYDFFTYSQSPQDRLFSTLGNPNMLAGFLIFMFWVMVGIAVDSRSLAHRLVIVSICAMTLWTLVYTYTKGAWIAFVASAMIWGAAAAFGLVVRRNSRTKEDTCERGNRNTNDQITTASATAETRSTQREKQAQPGK